MACDSVGTRPSEARIASEETVKSRRRKKASRKLAAGGDANGSDRSQRNVGSEREGHETATGPQLDSVKLPASHGEPKEVQGNAAERANGAQKKNGGRRARRFGSSSGFGEMAHEDVGHKLVVRLLPPNLTEEEFYRTLCPRLPSEQFLEKTTRDRYYVPGHYSRKPFKLPTYSRCYLIFYDLTAAQTLGRILQNMTFVDDHDNATVPKLFLSPYVKKMRNAGGHRQIQDQKMKLEGTLDKDPIFQIFTKSLMLMEENKDEYQYQDLHILHPLEKELKKRREVDGSIKKQVHDAMIELAGEIEREDKKKKRKKRKGQKSKNSKHEEKAPKENPNKVIFEEAGKREMKRRKREEKLARRKKKLEEKKKAVKRGTPREGTTGSSSTPASTSNKSAEPPQSKAAEGQKGATKSKFPKNKSVKSKPKQILKKSD
ncbi:AaceriAER204Wp [[Ashbya] aceris (nom. inval.)]|nr:AaceriAER204Wp [[Ashbya] aceris (nom. inval.)]